MKIRNITMLCALIVGLAGCYKPIPDPTLSVTDSQYLAKVPKFEVEMEYRRYHVDDPTGEPPGTIVVDTKKHFLYFVLPGKKAIRYGVATGNESQGWTEIGRAHV